MKDLTCFNIGNSFCRQQKPAISLQAWQLWLKNTVSMLIIWHQWFIRLQARHRGDDTARVVSYHCGDGWLLVRRHLSRQSSQMLLPLLTAHKLQVQNLADSVHQLMCFSRVTTD